MYKPDVTFDTTLSPASAFERAIHALQAIGTVTKMVTEENRIDALLTYGGKPGWVELRIRETDTGTKVDIEVVALRQSAENVAKRIAHAFENFDKPNFVKDTDELPPFVVLALQILSVLFVVGFFVYWNLTHH